MGSPRVRGSTLQTSRVGDEFSDSRAATVVQVIQRRGRRTYVFRDSDFSWTPRIVARPAPPLVLGEEIRVGTDARQAADGSMTGCV